ncbi:MAG: hypothetical protein DPW16_08430 [Chloroflexi bacterium]|nr:hypothetical protein [Chloroflexota bacterium]
MGKKHVVWVIIALLAIAIPKFQAQAQDDLQATLDLLTVAYQNSVTRTSYAAQWDGTTLQSTQLVQGDTVYIISTEIVESQTAQIDGASSGSSINQRVAQGQIVVPGPLESGAPLPEIEMIPQLELAASVVSIDGRVFINLDETAMEYRAGLPEGWQEIQEGMVLGGNGVVSLTELASSLDHVLLVGAVNGLLYTTIVQSAEWLPDETLNEQTMNRYLLTLNAAEAMAALEQDASALFGDLELSEEAVKALLNAAVYTLEVWVGVDDQMVHRQTLTLNLESALDSKTFGSDLGGAAVTITHHQSETLTLNELDAEFDIEMPLVEEGVG